MRLGHDFNSYLTNVIYLDIHWPNQISPEFMSQTVQSSDPEAWVEIVKQKVDSMRFGSVQIIVHEGRVTQVESTEKTRLASDSASSGKK